MQQLQYPNSSIDLRKQKKGKKKLRNKKTRYGIVALVATIHPSARQHLNSRLFKRDASKKVTMQVS
jgi:uracil-DNA glycosylase